MSRTTPLLAIIAAAGLAACGSTATSSNTAAKSDQMVTFAKCMRAHGVPNFPDPGSNGSGGIEIQSSSARGSGASMTVNGVSVSAPAFQVGDAELPVRAAERRPSAAAVRGPEGGDAPVLAVHARERAAELPGPGVRPGGQVQLRVGPQGGLDPSSPAFQQAQAACAKYQRGGGGFTAKAP